MEQPDFCMTIDNHYDVDKCNEIVMLSSEKENAEINGTDELDLGLQAVLDLIQSLNVHAGCSKLTVCFILILKTPSSSVETISLSS